MNTRLILRRLAILLVIIVALSPLRTTGYNSGPAAVMAAGPDETVVVADGKIIHTLPDGTIIERQAPPGALDYVFERNTQVVRASASTEAYPVSCETWSGIIGTW